MVTRLRRPRFQFTLAALFVLTTGCAIALSLVKMIGVGGVFWAVVILCFLAPLLAWLAMIAAGGLESLAGAVRRGGRRGRAKRPVCPACGRPLSGARGVCSRGQTDPEGPAPGAD